MKSTILASASWRAFAFVLSFSYGRNVVEYCLNRIGYYLKRDIYRLRPRQYRRQATQQKKTVPYSIINTRILVSAITTIAFALSFRYSYTSSISAEMEIVRMTCIHSDIPDVDVDTTTTCCGLRAVEGTIVDTGACSFKSNTAMGSHNDFRNKSDPNDALELLFHNCCGVLGMDTHIAGGSRGLSISMTSPYGHETGASMVLEHFIF